MKRRILKIHNFMLNTQRYKFITILILASYIALLPILPLLKWLGNNHPAQMAGLNLIQKIAYASILVPVIETFLFQVIIINLVMKCTFFKNIKLISILVSAFFFGLSHNYNLAYEINAFISGLILGYAYIFSKRRGDSPFFITAFIHGLKNLIATFLYFILELS
jgi:uncharacterized protein